MIASHNTRRVTPRRTRGSDRRPNGTEPAEGSTSVGAADGLPAPIYDDHHLPRTSRRRELADRIGTWRLYYGGDLFWAFVIIALFVTAAVFVGNVAAGASPGSDQTTGPSAPSGPVVAFATQPAERLTPHHPGPPWAVLEGCDLAEWHAAAAGLPVPLFREIAEAESGCRNDITNRYGRPCCHGAWQIHQLWLRDPAVQACGATDVASLRTDSPESWAVNACAAAHILEVQGLRAWQVCTKRMVRCW